MFLYNFDRSPKIVPSKFRNDIFDWLEVMRFLFRRNFCNFFQFFYHNFSMKGKFKMIMVSSERSRSDLSESTLFQIKNTYFLSIEISFNVKKLDFLGFFYIFFFELLPKYSYFVHSDDFIGNTS